ncbi:hypothetical protein ACOSQ4_009742 [Xanthoceras sorbifolium]
MYVFISGFKTSFANSLFLSLRRQSQGTPFTILFAVPSRRKHSKTLLLGPSSFLPRPPPALIAASSIKRKEVSDVTIEQLVSAQVDAAQVTISSSCWTLGFIAREYLDPVPTLYEDFLTSGLSQRIKMDKGMDLRNTLFRHTLMFHSPFSPSMQTFILDWECDDFNGLPIFLQHT